MAKNVLLFVIYCIVVSSLAYAPLGRYRMSETGGVNDSGDYLALVKGGIPKDPYTHRLLRPFVPFAAKPLYMVLRQKLPPDRAAEVALLSVNCFFAALAAMGITSMIRQVSGNTPAGVIAGLIYLSSFWTVNHFIPGLVDGAEACAAAWVMASLHAKQYVLTAVAIIVGTLSKETFLIFSVCMVLSYFLIQRHLIGWSTFLKISTGLSVSALGILAIRYYAYGTFQSPLTIAESFNRTTTPFLKLFIEQSMAPVFWFGIIWTLPAALYFWKRIPLTVSLPCIAAAVVASLLGAFHGAGAGNVARPIFSMLAPFVCWGGALAMMALTTEHKVSEVISQKMR